MRGGVVQTKWKKTYISDQVVAYCFNAGLIYCIYIYVCTVYTVYIYTNMYIDTYTVYVSI